MSIILMVFVFLCLHVHAHQSSEAQSSEAKCSEDQSPLELQACQWLDRQVKQFIDSRFPEVSPARLQYSIVVDPVPEKRYPQACDRMFTFTSSSQLLTGRVSLKASCQSPDQNWRQIIRAWVNLEVPVLVSRERLSPGSPLDDSGVTELAMKECSQLTRGFYVSRQDLQGAVAGRYISPGTVINPALVKQATVIKPGAPVTIFLEKGMVSVVDQGVALEAGKINSVIKVRRSSRDRVIRCRVINGKTVEPVQVSP